MMTEPATAIAPLEVQVLCLPEAMMGTVCTAVDVLRLACTILKLRNPNSPCPLTWKLIGPEDSPAWFDAAPDGMFASAGQAEPVPERTLIVLPALFVSNALDLQALALRYPALMALLKRHTEQGGLLAACANGLIFPALLGLLDGLRLDVHWAFKAYFVRLAPGCDCSSTEAMSFNRQLYTCVAPSQQTDFMIAILNRLLDATVGQGCARLLQLQTQRQQSGNQLAQHDWLLLTADSPVYRAKQWLEAHVEQAYDLAALAVVASSSERTLLRHFNTVLGMTPLEYLQDLRVQRAKVMLEISLNNMQTIAMACGYANASTFGKLFRRVMKMSPGDYRKHYTLRTKRAHWRVESDS
jgi:transcriptional regulator GlxA family with amidase domain